MIILPVGQADSEVRRWPYVTLFLAALNVLVFLFSNLSDQALEEKVQQKGQLLMGYWMEHPYLTPPDALTRVVGPVQAEKLHAQFRDVRNEYQQRGLLPITISEEQKTLERLANDLDAVRRESVLVRYGYVPADGRIEKILTSLFLHAGAWHLIGNMLFLLVLGAFLEDVWGRGLFAGFYVVSGFVAALTFAATQPGSVVPLVGASGAIAGIMGAFLVRLGRSRIRFLFMPIFFLPMLRFTFHIPAFILLPLWFVEQLAAARLSPDAPVAFWAHVGGFAFGVVVAVVVKAVKVEEKYIHPAIEKEISWEQDAGLQLATDARLAGDLEGARRMLHEVVTREPANMDAWRNLYDAAVAQGDRAEAGRAATRLLDLYQKANEPVLVSQILDDALRDARGFLPSKFLLAGAAQRDRAGLPEAAWELYQEIVKTHPREPLALKALLRMASLRRDWGRPDEAGQILAYARTHPACDPSWKLQIDKVAAESASKTALFYAPPPPLELPPFGKGAA